MATAKTVRTVCLDASILIAQFTEEDRSAMVRQFWADEPAKFSTPFCYFEAMRRFKTKFLARNGEPTPDAKFREYLRASNDLTMWFMGETRAGRVKDADFLKPSVYKAVRQMVVGDETSQNREPVVRIDYSDAFQIYSIKRGFYSRGAGGSRTVLITLDKHLAEAARKAGIQAQHLTLDQVPR